MADYQIDRNRWEQLGILEQMANIGSEVGRAIKARKAGKEDRVDGAITRALDLFAATTEQLARQKSPRLREVLRARNEFLRLFYDGTFDSDAEAIERYFTLFAIAARNQRDTS
ncbi:MAG: hypothetical protein LBG68_04710 [Coriobacteriales bacterium]|jgi:hypothetical protein|nr:hypothetical protein [Coriobacteriales bacterium]